MILSSGRAFGNAQLGVLSGPRKRLCMWIESYFVDGERMGIESIELDKSEVLKLFRYLADHLKTDD